MNDLAQQIRDRLDVLAAPPTGLIEFPEKLTDEQIAEFRRLWEEACSGPKVWLKRKHDLAPMADAAPGVMRAALLAVVERHGTYDFPADQDDGPGDYTWTPHCDYCWKPWPCPDLADIAKALGIEVADA